MLHLVSPVHAFLFTWLERFSVYMLKYFFQQYVHRLIVLVDQCDKPVKLGNFVFDEENHEQKSWKVFGRTGNRYFLFFFCANFCYSSDASMCNRSNYVIHNMWKIKSLGSYIIKYSRLYSTFSKAMNKIISKK